MRRLWAILAVALVTGCLRVGPGEDLHLVCEEKSNTPGPAYSLVDLVDLTRVQNATLTEAEERAILAHVQPFLITLMRRHHEDPAASLERMEDPTRWRFTLRGQWVDGTTDEYEVVVQDGFTYAPRASIERIPLPASVLAEAQRVAESEPAVAEARLRTPHLVGQGNDPALPACARLTYAGRAALDGVIDVADAPRTVVLVNLGQGRVVDIERDG